MSGLTGRRGQTLLLGVLMLFLLAVMVLITLGVGQRTRQRIEAQVAADTAAYSNAVVTARTLNQIALINRTRMSILVALLGVQSQISWSGHHRSHLAATATALQRAELPYIPCCGNPFCPQAVCACIELSKLRDAQSRISAEQQRIQGDWDRLDTDAAKYVSDLFIASVTLFSVTEKAVATLDDNLKHQLLTKAIVASASGDLDAPDKGDAKSLLETRNAPNCEDVGGLFCKDHDLAKTSRTAMMGTRGWHFVTARLEHQDLIQNRLYALIRPVNPMVGIFPPGKAGGSGVGPDKEAAQKISGAPYMHYISEDHGGQLNLAWPAPGCYPSGGLADVTAGWVKSNHSQMSGDEHKYAGAREPRGRHDIGGRGANRDSWPWTFEYNPHELGKPKNDFGQPKLYALVERRARNDRPWDLTTRLQFTGPGATLRPGDRPQVVLSSAIAYYHRPGAWKEPPSLWNPFWRATLAAPDDDIPKYVQKAGYTEEADAVKRLLKAGMAGTQ